MKRVVLTATALLLLATPANALFGDPPTKIYAQVGHWEIGWDQSIGNEKMGICYAKASYDKGTRFWIGSFLAKDKNTSWFLAIYNPEFKLDPSVKYNIKFHVQGKSKVYEADFEVVEHSDKKRFVATNITVEFANYLAIDQKGLYVELANKS